MDLLIGWAILIAGVEFSIICKKTKVSMISMKKCFGPVGRVSLLKNRFLNLSVVLMRIFLPIWKK